MLSRESVERQIREMWQVAEGNPDAYGGALVTELKMLKMLEHDEAIVREARPMYIILSGLKFLHEKGIDNNENATYRETMNQIYNILASIPPTH